jgi:pimeloyl-ACP methyl ester carboxylesterase
LLAALRRPSSVRVVVALAAVSDLGAAQALDLGSGAVRDFLGVDAQLRADLDPAQGGPFAVPVVAIHGADDSIVPLRLSHELAARDPACRLVALADTGHFDVIDPEVPQGRVVLAEIAAATRSA